MSVNSRYLLSELGDADFNSGYISPKNIKYELRKAARGILVQNNKIALLFVSKKNYHKLPGGGVEENESIEEAFKREILEETGCKCKIKESNSLTVEYRDQFEIFQVSYVFFAEVVGKPGKTNFVDDEIYDKFELKWVTVDEASRLFEKDKPERYEDKFIHSRDKSILEFYKNGI